jgi:hypothetical protein
MLLTRMVRMWFTTGEIPNVTVFNLKSLTISEGEWVL